MASICCSPPERAGGALLDRLVREELIDVVVQHDASVGMHRPIDVLAGPQRRDHERHSVFDTKVEVVTEPIVRLVHDLVDRKGSRWSLGMFFVVRLQFGCDPLEPFAEDRCGPRRSTDPHTTRPVSTTCGVPSAGASLR